MRKLPVVIALLGLSGGALAQQDDDALLARSRAIAKQLMETLGAALKKEMAEGGPAAAIKVCKSVAVDKAGELSRQNGAKVTRVSAKVRNPLLGSPDAWEQEGLLRLQARLDNGETANKLELAETVSEPQGRAYRYLKAVAVQPLCLSCHGPSEAIAADVKAVLASEYPKDQAIGYSVGQLRGAISIKLPR